MGHHMEHDIPPPPAPEPEPKPSWYKRKWGIALIVLGAFVIVGNLGGDDAEEPAVASEVEEAPEPEVEEAPEPEVEEEPEPEPERMTPQEMADARADNLAAEPEPKMTEQDIDDMMSTPEMQGLVLEMVWGGMNGQEQREFCDGYDLLGPEISHQFFAEGFGSDTPPLAVFRAFFNGKC
jgi:hypothetical protein